MDKVIKHLLTQTSPLYFVSSSSEQTVGTNSNAIKWCAVGHAETAKCDTWSINSVTDDTAAIECQNAPSVEECLKKIMVTLFVTSVFPNVYTIQRHQFADTIFLLQRKEADAMAVDGGEVYTAGKCGLVPAMVEQYDAGMIWRQHKSHIVLFDLSFPA